MPVFDLIGGYAPALAAGHSGNNKIDPAVWTRTITRDQFNAYIDKQGTTTTAQLQNDINSLINKEAGHVDIASIYANHPDYNYYMYSNGDGTYFSYDPLTTLETPVTQEEFDANNAIKAQIDAEIAAAIAANAQTIQARVDGSNWQAQLGQFFDISDTGSMTLKAGITSADINSSNLDPIVKAAINNYISAIQTVDFTQQHQMHSASAHNPQGHKPLGSSSNKGGKINTSA